jgi:hypothetical protein
MSDETLTARAERLACEASRSLAAYRTLGDWGDAVAATLRALVTERDAAIARAEAAEKERDALQAFKAYTHQRLDGAGVPTHPDGPHSAEGCRVGDRFDILLAQLELAREAMRTIAKPLAAWRKVNPNLCTPEDGMLQGIVLALDAALAATAAKEPKS